MLKRLYGLLLGAVTLVTLCTAAPAQAARIKHIRLGTVASMHLHDGSNIYRRGTASYLIRVKHHKVVGVSALGGARHFVGAVQDQCPANCWGCWCWIDESGNQVCIYPGDC